MKCDINTCIRVIFKTCHTHLHLLSLTHPPSSSSPPVPSAPPAPHAASDGIPTSLALDSWLYDVPASSLQISASSGMVWGSPQGVVSQQFSAKFEMISTQPSTEQIAKKLKKYIFSYNIKGHSWVRTEIQNVFQNVHYTEINFKLLFVKQPHEVIIPSSNCTACDGR